MRDYDRHPKRTKENRLQESFQNPILRSDLPAVLLCQFEMFLSSPWLWPSRLIL